MAKAKQEKEFLMYDNLTDEEIDAKILPCIRSAKEEVGHYNYKWSDEMLALRNYAIWRLIYKQGKSRVETMRNIKGRWCVHQSTAYEYIQIAEKEVNETYEDMKDDFRSKNMERLQRLYDDALEHNDRKSALSALEQMNKLQGLYTENKTITVQDIRFEFD